MKDNHPPAVMTRAGLGDCGDSGNSALWEQLLLDTKGAAQDPGGVEEPSRGGEHVAGVREIQSSDSERHTEIST